VLLDAAPSDFVSDLVVSDFVVSDLVADSDDVVLDDDFSALSAFFRDSEG
jgi:hypothetical protein